MTPRPLTLDPAVEEVLSDIARQGSSKLFLAEPKDFVRGWLGSGVQIGRNAPGLTNAERHLLDVHREEVARLLLERAAQALGILNPRAVVYRPDSMNAQRLRDRTSAAAVIGSKLEAPDAQLVAAIRLLTSAGAGQALSAAERSHLILWSIRLADRPNARVYAAYDAADHGCYRSALLMAQRIIARGAHPESITSAWLAVSVAEYNLGALGAVVASNRQALDVAMRAALAPASFSLASANAMRASVALGDSAAAAHYANLLDSLTSAADPAILWMAEWLRTAPSEKAQRGSVGWRFCQEFAQHPDRASGRISREMV